uniref:C-type lectin domain-containing protein n=1 Tax=Panagrolaimus sp. JU765 TaxID=591449 RepID=A0AC34QC87_9BILA
MLRSIILLVVCMTQIEGYNCPSGAVKSTTNNVCYTFSASPTTFVQAQVSCNEQGGNLVDVDSQKTNMDLIANIGKKNWDTFWIGGNVTQILNNVGLTNVWIWEGVRKIMDYNNWAPNEPVDKKGCAAVNGTDGAWFVEDCSSQKNYVCSIPMKMDVCDDQWTYFAPSGFCYKVYFHSDWSSAETACVAQDGHLASVHSKQEDSFIQGKHSSVKSVYNFPDLSRCGQQIGDASKGTIIGLYTTTNDNTQWQWSDGSTTDYIPWGNREPNYPGKEKCGSIYTDETSDGPAGYWNNMGCGDQIRNFVCKKSPAQVYIK